MIVEDQLDRRMGRIGGVEELEEFDEFAASVAVLDEGVDLAGEQIDAGQQADRAVALVLVVAREGGMSARFGRQVRGGRVSTPEQNCIVFRSKNASIMPTRMASSMGSSRGRQAWVGSSDDGSALLRRERRLL
jgi:hypothetical protein